MPAEMSKRLIAASDDCLKRDKKRRLLKAKCTGDQQFDCPTEVGHVIDVDNIEYTITSEQNIEALAYRSTYLVDTRRC